MSNSKVIGDEYIEDAIKALKGDTEGLSGERLMVLGQLLDSASVGVYRAGEKKAKEEKGITQAHTFQKNMVNSFYKPGNTVSRKGGIVKIVFPDGSKIDFTEPMVVE